MLAIISGINLSIAAIGNIGYIYYVSFFSSDAVDVPRADVGHRGTVTDNCLCNTGGADSEIAIIGGGSGEGIGEPARESAGDTGLLIDDII